jgi:hypothetical protein
MIIGAHSVIYSTDPDADRAFLRDVLKLPSVDVGDGWLIFGLPPAEVALHPSNENNIHEFYLMTDDAAAFLRDMKRRNIGCSEAQNLGWGVLLQVTLPGGGTIGVYEPRHARPKAMTAGKAPAAPRKSSPRKKASPKKTAKRAPKKPTNMVRKKARRR